MVTNKTTDYSSLDFVNGETLLIDKPFKWTSFKVVHTIRKTINVKRVGHTGTLDPIATGLLIVLTGKQTKQMVQFEGLDKTYTGTFLLGKTSPSMDTETEITEKEIPRDLNYRKLNRIKDTFIGEIEQIPPMFSAIKVKGKKLYELARQGKSIKRDPRKVRILEFDLLKIDLPEIHFKIRCSKGTYIRVIASDFGNKAGCGALLNSLRRTNIGDYRVDEAIKVDDFVRKAGKLSKMQTGAIN